MDHDYILVAGILIGLLAFPSLLNAYSTGRPPRAAMVLIALGSALVGWAVVSKPSTYTLAGLPEVFMRVASDLLR